MANVRNEYMPRGEKGTRQTIDRMHQLVAQGKLDPTLHKIASWIRIEVPEDIRGDTRQLADEIFWFVREHGIFQPDPHQIERIEHPMEAMRPVIEARRNGSYRGPGLFVGDCDLYSIFIATLGGILGFPYSWETVKVDVTRPDEYSHIYPALLVKGEWIAYDASRANAAPNVRPKVPAQLFARWPEGEIEKVVGMSGFGDIVSEDEGYREGMYAEDYVGYGIPKTFGNGAGPGVIPQVDPGILYDDIPHTPAESVGDILIGETSRELKKVRSADPTRGASNIRGFYLPRPVYEPPQEMYEVRPPYDKTWPFQNQVLATEQELHGRLPGNVPSPEGYDLVYAGMGETREELEGLMSDHLRWVNEAMLAGDIVTASHHQEEADKIAAQLAALDAAGGSVMDTVDDVLSDLVKMVPGISDVFLQQQRDKYKEKILEAQTRLAQAEADKARATAEMMGGVKTPAEWYENPLVILAGVAALGVVGYLALNK